MRSRRRHLDLAGPWAACFAAALLPALVACKVGTAWAQQAEGPAEEEQAEEGMDAQEPSGAAEGLDEDESAAGDDEGADEDHEQPAAGDDEGADEDHEQPAGDATHRTREEEEEAPSELPGGTTTILGPAPEERTPEDSRLIIPPFYMDHHGDTSTVAFFPFYFDRSSPEDHQLLVGPYYRRRSLELNADVVFPFFWSFRTVGSTTVAVPPFYYHHAEDGYDWGLAPLVFNGRSADATYTVIPPLLTVSWADDENAHTFAGPFWRIRDHERVDWGIFPLLWASHDDVSSRTILAPFYFHFSDEEEHSSTTVIPPVYHHLSGDGTMWGFAGLLHHYHDDEGTSWTIPPLLFHYSRFGRDLRLITPLFGYFDVGGRRTLITPLYQRYRGDTELDAVAPFFFSYRDPRQRSSSLWIPPLIWHYESPSSNATLVLPFFARWHERGLYSVWATPLVAHYESDEEASASTWIFPTVQLSHTPDSSTFNIHPLLYSTRARTHRHFVLAPLYWDFENYEKRSRTTIFFPLFWRFRDGSTVRQLAGNTYYHHWREGGVPGWEFHFFPLFAYGEPRPGDYWWSVLYGLAGYRRQGAYARASVLWVPFQVDGPAEN